MAQRPVLIACHAGPGVGLGHVTRALGIARALHDDGHPDVHLVIHGPAFDHLPLLAWQHQFVADDAALAAAIAAHAPHLLLLDLMPSRAPAGLAALLARCRAQGTRLVAIDGLLAHRAALDLVFIPNFRVPLPDGTDLTGPPGHAPVLHGWDCFLLAAPAWRRPWLPDPARPPRVLALTGGSDATGLGAHWPLQLDARLPQRCVLDWVTGPFAPPPRLPSQPRLALHEHRAPSGLGPLMLQARYAVTVFGVSFFELLAHGVPTVVFSPYGSKDAATLDALAEAGVALVAADETEATDRLLALMADDALAQRLSQQALAHMAVPGGRRLAQALRAGPGIDPGR